jgi:hypothetical protein
LVGQVFKHPVLPVPGVSFPKSLSIASSPILEAPLRNLGLSEGSWVWALLLRGMDLVSLGNFILGPVPCRNHSTL